MTEFTPLLIEVRDTVINHIKDGARIEEYSLKAVAAVNDWLADPLSAEPCRAIASEIMTDRIFLNSAFYGGAAPKRWTYAGAHLASAAWYASVGNMDSAFCCLRCSIAGMLHYYLPGDYKEFLGALVERCRR